MSSLMDTVKEWINPDWVRHRSVPRMETGLRPNLRLDESEIVVEPGEFALEDITTLADGAVVLASGTTLHRLGSQGTAVIADLGAPVTAIAAAGGDVVAAVTGRGIVSVGAGGEISPLCEDPAVRDCVTALVLLPDGAVLATVGTTTPSVEGDWARALLAGDSSGRLVRVAAGAAEVVADRLPWPSGIALSGTDEVILALSLAHRLEIRGLADLGRTGRAVATNLPVYPGRVIPADDGHWVAAPYPRNRVTELLLDEDDLVRDMTAQIDRDQWFVPLLAPGNLFTEAMQMGQLRVLGVVKSWAPARSAGIVFRLDEAGRIAESAHARVDSARHGVTGVTISGDEVLLALAGHGSVLALGAARPEARRTASKDNQESADV